MSVEKTRRVRETNQKSRSTIKASVRAINPNQDVTENQERRNESQKQRSWGMGERGAVVGKGKKNDARTICEDLDVDALVNLLVRVG